ADRALRSARELAPTAPVTWETFIQFLVATGQSERARAEIEAVQKRLTKPAAAEVEDRKSLPAVLALARCQQQVGQTEEARALYEAALKLAGDDAEVLSDAAGFYLRAGRFSDGQGLVIRLRLPASGPGAARA